MIDLKHALRMLLTRPAFSVSAIVTLAIGIGGATAMFGIIDAVLLRPLPFRDPSTLVMIWEYNPGFTGGAVPASPGNFLAWQQIGAFDGLAALTETSLTAIFDQAEPVRVRAATVTPGFFELLGVAPAQGAHFQAMTPAPQTPR